MAPELSQAGFGVRAQSKKRQADAPRRRKVREVVFERDGDCLLRAYRECHGPLTPHHIQKASQCGRYEEFNLLTLCLEANDWVEAAPDEAWALGLVVRAGDSHEEAAERRRLAGIVPGLRRYVEHPYDPSEPF